ncbi:MAG TPA: enoyl-CoA hydratase [Chondromyces sp.]|nr:enoyl-CoA hydratase [Chondromyces sp.]
MTLVTMTIENSTAIVTIDNPPLNVMSQQVTKELSEIYRDCENNSEVLSIILTGAGSRAFMAGADIKEFPERIGKEGNLDYFMQTHAVLNQLESVSKPVIAVLNGLTLGGGCELALTADIRIAEEHAQIGLPEIKLGLFPGGGGTQRLPRLIGAAKAKELMFLGDPISAKDAEKIGLVNKVAASGQGIEEAKKWAAKINGYSLQALSRIKQAVNVGVGMPLQEGIELEARLFEEVFKTEDIKEGVQAFIEKRKPEFTNR